MCMSSSLFLGTSQSEEEVSFWLLQCLQKSLWPHVRNLTQCWPQRIPQAERGEEVQLFTLLLFLFLSGLQALPLSILYYGFLYVYVQFVHRLASLECVCDQPWIGFLDIWNPCKSVLFQIKKKKKDFIIQHLQASSHLFYVGWEKIYISLWISCCEEPGPHSNGRMASVQTAIMDERVANARAQWWPKGPCSIYHDVWDLKEKLSVLPRRRSSRRCPPKAWTHYSNAKNPIEMPHYKHLHVKMVRENWSWSEKP